MGFREEGLFSGERVITVIYDFCLPVLDGDFLVCENRHRFILFEDFQNYNIDL